MTERSGNANIILASLHEFFDDIAEDYRPKTGEWSDVKRLFASYQTILQNIIGEHVAEAESMIEDYLGTPALALKPRSQMYVENVANDVWSGFESAARDLRAWLERTGIEKIRRGREVRKHA